MAGVQIERVSRYFGETRAVDDVSLDIADGDFLVLLGPSGCGKSTLLRMLAGLLPTSRGRFLLDGEDITDKHARNRDLAMVFQNYALYPHLDVRDNMAFPLRSQKAGRDEVAAQVGWAAERLGIAHLLHRKPRELSGGQRQRVALGRAIVRRPKVFLMDEPLSNLDAKLRTTMRRELIELHRALGATFVYVTHDQVEAMTMATRIAILNDGHLEQVGTPDEVYSEPASTFVAGFIGSPPMNLVDGAVQGDAGWIRVEGDTWDGLLWPGAAQRQEVRIGVRPEHLALGPLTGKAGVQMNAVVRFVERLGHENLVTVTTTPSCDLVMRVTGPHLPSEGDHVCVSATPEHIHLFDAPTGRRLHWIDDGHPESNSSISLAH